MAKRVRNNYSCLHRITVFIFFLIFVGLTEIRADTYWIIENSSALIIYNQYEQRLTDTEKSAFQNFAAWEIISEDHFLSDQFTPVIKASYKNKTYYFQRLEPGKILKEEDVGKIEILKNVKPAGDTIRVKQTDKIFLIRAGERLGLSEGTLLKCRFKYQNRFYVENMSTDQNGWITLEDQNSWEKYHVEPGKGVDYDWEIFSQVDKLVNTYNQRLGNLFDYMNAKYKTHHPLPRWSGEKTALSIRYKMEPNAYRNRFNESQFFLIQELRDLLHGSSFHVTEDQNQIIISKKSN